MILSDTSIKRPVFATVISLLLVVLGISASSKLPVREYPAIDPPIISIVTVYRGASNDVVQTQVTEVVEAAIAGIEGIKQITGRSREERSSVSIEFHLSRSIEAAAADVRDRMGRILDDLPPTVEPPQISKHDADDRPILWFTMTSDQRSSQELTDFVSRNLRDRMSVVPGVASVTIGGERRYAMRVWLDRRAMAARGLTVEDLETAVRRSNLELPSGRIESSQLEFTVKTDARLKTPDEFSRIVVASRGGYPTRLGEVARVEIGPEDERSELRSNGKPAVGLGILRQSTANTLSVAKEAKAEMERLRPSIPADITVDVAYDESVFIERSIFEVMHALGIGMILVISVIFIFLRSVRATLIPAVAIPVSLIAALPILAGLGFSINVLTLLALVLAIGIVVDDAIVVLENIHRRIELGEPPLLAATRGARQIAFAVISTTLVLASVFVPISFMEGNTGRLFSEFGIALAAAVLFSGFIALTLSPMMCSKLLRPHSGEGWLYRTTEPGFQALIGGYRWMLSRALDAPVVVLAVGLMVSLAAYTLYIGLPKEFAPTEDRGIIIIPVDAPEGASIEYTREQIVAVEDIVRPYLASGEARLIMSTLSLPWMRPAPVNTGIVSVRLTTWEQRGRKQQDIAREIFPKILAIPGARAVAVNPASLGHRGFRNPVQLVLKGNDYETLKDWRDIMMDRLRADGRFANVDDDYKESKPEVRISIDRLKAADLGVSLDQIGATLQVMFGSREAGRFTVAGEEYKVIAQAVAEDRQTTRDLTSVFVRSRTTNQLIPLSNLVTIAETAGPANLIRVDRMNSITVSASLQPGYPLGQALDNVRQMVAENLPSEAQYTWRGESRNYVESEGSIYITFALALLIVFLVLAAQFESWIHPFIIMLSVPLAVTGGLAALVVTNTSLNIYSQIGMILLIGLMAKNGILIVEFANQLREQGRSVRDAVLESATIRLRPILMTSISTACGALPLALATGAGAESRSSVGVVIIGGTLVSTVFTLFVIPSLYLLLARFTKPINDVARRLSRLEAESPLPSRAHAPAE